MRTAASLLVPLLLPVAAQAADYECRYGDMQRRIEIIYEPGLAVPCEVHYYRDADSAESREVLWRAQNEAGYCEARTEELVSNLRSYGWECKVAGAAAEDVDVDDTDALAPPSDIEAQR